MAVYKIDTSVVTVNNQKANMVRIGFGSPAQNTEIVQFVDTKMDELVSGEIGGKLALINGPASLPVAVVLTHHLMHRFEAIGVFDPKMAGYVVATSHGGEYKIGDLIPADKVVES